VYCSNKQFQNAKAPDADLSEYGAIISCDVCGALVAWAGCSRNVHVPASASIPAADNSYVDLESGWRLSIVVPLVKSGGTRPTLSPQQNAGNTISLSAGDLTGYEISQYAITGRSNGAVRLKFTSAEITKDGKTVLDPTPPALPFTLPRGSEHIRLIYLVRASQADHNMAVAASKRLDALNVFTKQLNKNPDVCKTSDEVSCAWVPAGVAVRPEPRQP
jgi:hypothetical protein